MILVEICGYPNVSIFIGMPAALLLNLRSYDSVFFIGFRKA
jgi:hypothetical protein